MIGPAGYRSCLARSQPRTTPSDEDLQAMRRAAWRTQGVIMLGPEDVRDDWTRQALINKTNRLYGRRSGGGRGAPGSSRTRSRAASSRRSGRRIRTDASWCITGRSTRLARCCAPAPSRRRCTTRTRASSAGGGVAGVRVDCHTAAACRYGSAISGNTLATGCRKYPGSRQARPVVAPAAAAFQFASRYRPPLNRGRLAPARLPHRFQTRRLPRHGGHHVDPDSG
jgi:hypothetical protein